MPSNNPQGHNQYSQSSSRNSNSAGNSTHPSSTPQQGSRNQASNSQQNQSAGNHNQMRGGTREQHAEAGRQSHKNDR